MRFTVSRPSSALPQKNSAAFYPVLNKKQPAPQNLDVVPHFHFETQERPPPDAESLWGENSFILISDWTRVPTPSSPKKFRQTV